MPEKFKQGDIAFLRTTGEPTYVLEVDSEGSIKVRRAVMTQANGIVHETDRFQLDEFETEQEKNDREETMNLAADVRKFRNFKKIQELVAKEQPQAKVEMQQMDLPGVLDS